MLKRQHRVPKNIFPLLRKNKVYEGEIFSLRVTFFDTGCARIICIVSKKVNPKASARNKIKRRVYSILNPILTKSTKAAVVQIFPKKNVNHKNFKEIETSLSSLITDNNIL